MSVKQKKIESLYKILKHDEFGYIKSINYFRETLDEKNISESLSIELDNCPFIKADEVLIVTFKNVVELRIGDIGSLYRVMLSIKDISSYQIENVCYKVLEEENNLFSFACKDFDFYVKTSDTFA